MAKIAQTTCTKPSAWIVSPKDKGRKSIKKGKVFLKNGDEFEIELFNPLTVSVLADIKLNGNPISKTGLILKPGQRFYLDCFIDDRKKFVFNTYEIDGSQESLDATQNNGLLEVFFYKEDVITIDNWRRKFDKIIVEKWYPIYYPYYPYDPYYPRWRWWCNDIYYGSGTTYGGVLNGGGTTTIGTSYNNCTTTSNNAYTSNNALFTANSDNLFSSDVNVDINNLVNKINNNIETGRVEKGEKSSQKFTEIEMDFESNYISSTIIQILPESRKPVETKEIKKETKEDDSNEVIELIKKLADLHKAGILTEEEFNNKKSELLSKL